MLQLKEIKCGKKGCSKCPHGFYVYAYWRQNNKIRSKYLGKVGDPETQRKVDELAKDHPRVTAEYETMYLESTPGVKEKILKGINTPLSECQEDNIKESVSNANAAAK
jgi:hypothetical protein